MPGAIFIWGNGGGDYRENPVMGPEKTLGNLLAAAPTRPKKAIFQRN
jgi:hypothetical protein